MSRPAISCARRCVDTASSYCSRQRALTIASRKLLLPNETVCHAGRGSEPIIDVGSRVWAEALYMHRPPFGAGAPARARTRIFKDSWRSTLSSRAAGTPCDDEVSFSAGSKKSRSLNPLYYKQNDPRFVVSAWSVRNERLRFLGLPPLRSGKCLGRVPSSRRADLMIF